ncbi:TetR/AcrR family transcriptional regulator [Sporolactobacillus spathodeae]|uniref:AcrR family transcriptional regulator n=1 Tax=Sporolactobacillus spathodeae TaxID=1465502 RepID=A0ABS2QAC5_9BACL|nr:TetR/AcrR family transcriptional regulator [Sporolactobacillus spathodeae]MBM7658748.1 AcrR family transcriptional regulator [Sporolactobacillus spathodeae]
MRERILDVAAHLIEKYGLRKFTLDEIARELKISKKTIYQHFESKEAIVRAFFDMALITDKESVREGLNRSQTFAEKIHATIYSEHRFCVPVPLIQEAKLFYPDVYEKVERFKQFKIDTLNKILVEGIADGTVRASIHISILSALCDKIANIVTDYDFLLESKLTAPEAIDELVGIILRGILN